MVKEERTGWRDKEISWRHRFWGDKLCLMDLDGIFTGLETDGTEPIAIIEYKHERAPKQSVSEYEYKVLIRLGDLSKLPVFAVRYANNWSWWHVIPLNNRSKQILPSRQRMNEYEYVKFLYQLRKIEMPPKIKELFDGT